MRTIRTVAFLALLCLLVVRCPPVTPRYKRVYLWLHAFCVWRAESGSTCRGRV